MKRFIFFGIISLLTISCGDTLVIDPTPLPPPPIKQTVNWNLIRGFYPGTNTPNSYTLEVYVDGKLSRSITAENGTSVSDMYDQYLEVGNMVQIGYTVAEDENGNRIVPDICETGGSIATITFSSLPEDDPFFKPASQKTDKITVKTCLTVRDVGAKISSVRLMNASGTRATFEVVATEKVQCVFEYGTESRNYTMSGIPERSFNYSTHMISAGNVTPLTAGTTYYGRAVVVDDAGTPYFSKEIVWTQQ